MARIFRHAIEVGKRSRAETGIGRGATSLSSAALGLATARPGTLGGRRGRGGAPSWWSAAVARAPERLGTLVERRVLVLGAGEMGEGMARSLAGSGVAEAVGTGRGTARYTEPATP